MAKLDDRITPATAGRLPSDDPSPTFRSDCITSISFFFISCLARRSGSMAWRANTCTHGAPIAGQ